MTKLNGRLTPEDKAYIDGAFRLLLFLFLPGPTAAPPGGAT